MSSKNFKILKRYSTKKYKKKEMDSMFTSFPFPIFINFIKVLAAKNI